MRVDCRVLQEDEEAADAGEPGVLPAPSIGDRERRDSANSLDAAVRLAGVRRRQAPAAVLMHCC
jgi:hypothetical protein